MNKLFLSVCLILFEFILSIETTKDPEFEKKFQIEHLREGDKMHYPKIGDKVGIHYIGTLEDGKEFANSYKRGKSFEFKLGEGGVIKCWDIVVPRLSLGEKIKIICPPDLSYGIEGVGELIPPNSKLIFQIELKEIDTSEDL